MGSTRRKSCAASVPASPPPNTLRRKCNRKYDAVSIFIRSCLFLNVFCFLHEEGCCFLSSYLHVQIHSNQTVLFWVEVFRKKFLVKAYSSILKFAPIVYIQNFWTKFLSPCYSLLSADMESQNCGRSKRILFHGEAKMYKNGQKRTENGYCVNPPQLTYCSNCTPLRYKTNSLFRKNNLCTLPIISKQEKIIDFFSIILAFEKIRIAQPRYQFLGTYTSF